MPNMSSLKTCLWNHKTTMVPKRLFFTFFNFMLLQGANIPPYVIALAGDRHSLWRHWGSFTPLLSLLSSKCSPISTNHAWIAAFSPTLAEEWKLRPWKWHNSLPGSLVTGKVEEWMFRNCSSHCACFPWSHSPRSNRRARIPAHFESLLMFSFKEPPPALKWQGKIFTIFPTPKNCCSPLFWITIY